MIFIILGLCGILASLYAINVEKNATGKKKYVAFCDVNDSMSCSRVLTSEYANLSRIFFGFDKNSWFNRSNTYYGVLFYLAVMLYPFWPFTLVPFREYLLLGASIGSIAASCTLAYILTFKLHNFCLVCVVTYVINGLILYNAWGEAF